MDWLWTLGTIAEILWIIGLAIWIVQERRSPVATLAWIAVLAWVPALGILVYYFIGPRRLHRRRAKRAASTKVLSEAFASLDEYEGDTIAQLAQLAVQTGEPSPLPAERVDIYTEGQECYAAIVKAIEDAKHHVHVAYYIFEADQIGTRLRDLLARRAKEGIEVRLLLDGIGAYGLTDRYLAPIVGAGGKVEWFNSVALTRLRPRLANFRTHRKIVVCDGTVGFTGGMNVTDVQTREFSGDKAWRDTHVRVIGPAVRSLQRVFLEDWHYASGEAVTGSEYLARVRGAGDHYVQIVASGPDQDVYAIHKLFFAAIAGAHERVWITTPYFVPDEPIQQAMVTAALRGVDVRLLVPASGDSALVDMAARSHFPELLKAGVRIWEYLPRFLHAKTMLVDAEFAVVGTANMDNRSFRLNFEVVAAMYGSEHASRLAAAFMDDIAESRELTKRTLKREPFLKRFGEAAARLFSPML